MSLKALKSKDKMIQMKGEIFFKKNTCQKNTCKGYRIIFKIIQRKPNKLAMFLYTLYATEMNPTVHTTESTASNINLGQAFEANASLLQKNPIFEAHILNTEPGGLRYEISINYVKKSTSAKERAETSQTIVSEIEKMRNLETLVIVFKDAGNIEVENLAVAIGKLKKLKKLKIVANFLEDSGIIKLSEAIGKLKNLTELEISLPHCGYDGAMAFAAALNELKETLTILQISFLSFSQYKVAETLKGAVEDLKNLEPSNREKLLATISAAKALAIKDLVGKAADATKDLIAKIADPATALAKAEKVLTEAEKVLTEAEEALTEKALTEDEKALAKTRLDKAKTRLDKAKAALVTAARKKF